MREWQNGQAMKVIKIDIVDRVSLKIYATLYVVTPLFPVIQYVNTHPWRKNTHPKASIFN